jgi:hypothetical protein
MAPIVSAPEPPDQTARRHIVSLADGRVVLVDGDVVRFLHL